MTVVTRQVDLLGAEELPREGRGGARQPRVDHGLAQGRVVDHVELDARPKMVFVLSIFLLSILISDILFLAVLFGLVMAGGHRRQGAEADPRAAEIHRLRRDRSSSCSASCSRKGSHVVLDLGLIKVKMESLLFATSMCLRLFLAIAAFAIMTFTIHPDQMLRVLSKFGFKSMTGLSIATRMYPTIAADSINISDAMKARGVEFDDGNCHPEGPGPRPGDDALAAQFHGAVDGDRRGHGGAGLRGREEDAILRYAPHDPRQGHVRPVPGGHPVRGGHVRPRLRQRQLPRRRPAVGHADRRCSWPSSRRCSSPRSCWGRGR